MGHCREWEAEWSVIVLTFGFIVDSWHSLLYFLSSHLGI